MNKQQPEGKIETSGKMEDISMTDDDRFEFNHCISLKRIFDRLQEDNQEYENMDNQEFEKTFDKLFRMLQRRKSKDEHSRLLFCERIPIWSTKYADLRLEEAQRALDDNKDDKDEENVNTKKAFSKICCFRDRNKPNPLFHCPGRNGEFRRCSCDPEVKKEDDYRSFILLQMKTILQPEGRGTMCPELGGLQWRLSLAGSTNDGPLDFVDDIRTFPQGLHRNHSLDSNAQNKTTYCSPDSDQLEMETQRKVHPCSDTDSTRFFCHNDLTKPEKPEDDPTSSKLASVTDKEVHGSEAQDYKVFVDFAYNAEANPNEKHKIEIQKQSIGSFVWDQISIKSVDEKLKDSSQDVPGFMKALLNTFQLIIDDWSSLSENDWISAKTCFLHKVRELCQEAYEKKEPLSLAEAIASALHIVNALSISKFDEFVLSQKENDNYWKIMPFLCFCLANQHFAVLANPKKTNDKDWYDTKCDILAKHLNSLATGKRFTQTEENCVYLLECAQLIGDDFLVNEVLSKMKQKKFLHKTCSTTCREKEEKLPQILQLVDHDGNIYDRARDPPSQRSVYIPPGDSNRESYRLLTFIKYPQEVPVNPRHLASAGFYYTGYKDRVKCFSCGLCCENWVFGDDVRSAQWHRSDCNFVRGLDSDNVPIGGGGLARFMVPPKHHDGNIAMETAPPANFTASSGTARNVQQTSHQPSAGSVLLSSSSNQSVPMQTARPVQRNQAPSSVFQIVEFATIPSAYHENFLKNLDLRKESERLRTFEHWPSETPTVYPADLAKSGFFYLGNLDRVQCFSCGGVLRNWNYGDNVNSEHRRHFPHCKLCQGAEPRNVPLSPDERAAAPPQQMVFHEPPDPSENEARDLRNMFQCQFPVSPHMRNEDTRLETFDQRWLSAQINATPRQIARAGFFLGDRDRVKCWYCNGGLPNWDQQGEPWTEHAKWFPTCEFLLQRKGPDFVHRMVSMFPNLPRPLLCGPFDVPPANPGRRIQCGTASVRAPSPPPPIIDPRAERQRERQKIRDAMNSEIVKTAIEMGFERKNIRHVVKRRIRRSEMFTTVEQLVDDITNYESDALGSDDDDDEGETQVKPTSANVPSTEVSMQAINQELQEERKCEICLDNIGDTRFHPCGHWSCDRCAGALQICPMCNMKINHVLLDLC